MVGELSESRENCRRTVRESENCRRTVEESENCRKTVGESKLSVADTIQINAHLW